MQQVVERIVAEPIERLCREPERKHITGRSRAAWWRLERAGKAPKRITVDRRTVAWRLSDLQAWVRAIVEGREWS